MPLSEEDIQRYRQQFGCGFKEIDSIFGDCMNEAVYLLSSEGVERYLDGAAMICMIGRGVEPVLDYLEEMPRIARRLGEDSLELIARTVWRMSRTSNGGSIPPFMQTLGEAARRLGSWEQIEHYIDITMGLGNRTSSSVHNNEGATYPSPSLPDYLERVPYLLSQHSIEGLRNWVE